MWITKLKLKHDCIIAGRAEKFGVIVYSYDLNQEEAKSRILTHSIHHLEGEKKSVDGFLRDLKKDKRVEYLEVSGNTFFMIDSAKNKPVSKITKRIFYVKPTISDKKGFEYWEIASHRKEELMRFIAAARPLVDYFELLNIQKTKLQHVYFPKTLPNLTDLQKKALDLAVTEGYYDIPKKTSLRKLAKLMGLALATYQRHLQKAESKIIPDVLYGLK